MREAPKTRSSVAEYGLLCAWFAAALLLIVILTFASASMRAGLLIRSVNGLLEKEREPRRLAASAPTWGAEGRAALSGSRFSLEKARGGALVFAVASGGLVANCVAFIDEEGGVESVLPLGGEAGDALARMPAGLLQVYIARIEKSERALRSREKSK